MVLILRLSPLVAFLKLSNDMADWSCRAQQFRNHEECMLDGRVISDTVDRDCALPALARHDSDIPSLQTYDPVPALCIFGNEVGYVFVKVILLFDF
jgi:hypothetical protein